MHPVYVALAVTPLALYLLWLGFRNLSRRPRLTTGVRDMVLLSLALLGFVVVGPMKLFTPAPAAMRFGPYIWLLLLSFYGLCVTLGLLLAKPRLIVFNLTAKELQPVLEKALAELDPEVRWAGESVIAPHLGVQLHVQDYPSMRNVVLTALGERHSFTGWRRLQEVLDTALAEIEVAPNPRGISFVVIGLVLLGYPVWLAISDREVVAQKLWELFQL